MHPDYIVQIDVLVLRISLFMFTFIGFELTGAVQGFHRFSCQNNE